ncbi:MAG: hypothetical protein ACSHX6_13100 [Akkermansiaceae bacterium]
MNALEIDRKRRFWRRVLVVGIMVIVIALMAIVAMYASGMADARVAVANGSEMEQEIALLGARRELLFGVVKWLAPTGLLSSLMINVARYKLRKLKKIENEVVYSH